MDVRFSPDGRMLAVADAGEITLLDSGTGKVMQSFTGHVGSAHCVSFSPYGDLLASGGMDGHVILWDLAQRKPLHVLYEHEDYVESVAFSPGGVLLATVCRSPQLRVWDARTGALVHKFASPGSGLWSVAWTHDGKGLLCGDLEGDVHHLDAATGRSLRTFKRHKGTLRALALSRNGKRLVGAGMVPFSETPLERAEDDGNLHIWDFDSGDLIRSHLLDNFGVWHVAYASDGQRIAAACHTAKKVVLLDGEDGRIVGEFPHWRGLTGVDFSPDGRRLVTVAGDCMVRLWDAATGRRLNPTEECEDGIYALALSPDGSVAACAMGYSRCGELWDCQSGKKIRRLTCNGYCTYEIAFAHAGARLITVTVDEDGRHRHLELWDFTSGRIVLSFSANSVRAAFSPDGSLLAIACTQEEGGDWQLRFYHCASGRLLGESAMNQHEIGQLVFSPDGERLATLSGCRASDKDKSVRTQTLALWNSSTRQRLGAPRELPGGVFSSAFSPDGSQLALSCDPDRTNAKRLLKGPGLAPVYLFDGRTGEPAGLIKRRSGDLAKVYFTRDGRQILAAGRGTLSYLDVASRSEVEFRRLNDLAEDRLEGWTLRDGRIWLVGRSDSQVTIWDPLANAILHTLDVGHHHASIYLSPDGKRLFAHGFRPVALIWNLHELRSPQREEF